MNTGNIPSDKRDAEIYLKGAKQAILELFSNFERFDIDASAHILGTMANQVDAINELLGESMTSEQYDTEAKADNLTEGQFPNV